MSEITGLRDGSREFTTERGWNEFHSRKNLASALAVEAAELLEPFQWLTEAQGRNLHDRRRAVVADELSDVQIYVIHLADNLGVDLLQAVRSRMVRNAGNYPVDPFEGSARKYPDS